MATIPFQDLVIIVLPLALIIWFYYKRVISHTPSLALYIYKNRQTGILLPILEDLPLRNIKVIHKKKTLRTKEKAEMISIEADALEVIKGASVRERWYKVVQDVANTLPWAENQETGTADPRSQLVYDVIGKSKTLTQGLADSLPNNTRAMILPFVAGIMTGTTLIFFLMTFGLMG
jgi:hypothetical protein